MVAHAKPSLSITGANVSCNGDVSLTLTGASSGSTISWFEGANSLGSGTNLNLTGVANGVPTYRAVLAPPAEVVVK